MSVINTNVKSLMAQNAMSVNNRHLTKTMEQLSTGTRLNSAADDAAGLAISNKMTAQVRGLNQAVRNANDAISMIQTAEGATKEITNMLQRMRELSVQAANDTYTEDDRSALQAEYSELHKEIDRISSNTQWNGMNLFAGTAASASSGGVGTSGVAIFQVGANANVTGTAAADFTISVTFEKMNATSIGLTILPTTAAGILATHSTAQGSIAEIDTAIINVDKFRADLGSKINRLTYSIDNLTNVSQNTQASRSQIRDTDYAAATTELARTQIISQAASAMLAQANQQPQSVLSLLR
jgi:flagellin